MYRTVRGCGRKGEGEGVASDIYFDAADYLSTASRTRNNRRRQTNLLKKLELSILYFALRHPY